MITHYWSIIRLSNPPLVIWKQDDGKCVEGYSYQGELPNKTTPVNEPSPIIGYHPETHVYGHPFGVWLPISEWLSKPR